MSLRARNRRHRSRGSVGKRIIAVLLGLLSLIVVAIGGLTVWVLNVAADAPDIDTLQPADDGANSQIFAADGDEPRLRRSPTSSASRSSSKKIPKDLQEGTIAIED